MKADSDREWAEYHDPRLVALYDTTCPSRADTHFYLELADELAAETIVDIGCGTGLLAAALAARDPGRTVIGVEPSEAMLAVARSRDGGDRVRWVHGDAGALDVADADLVVMTGHVAQIVTDSDAWAATLVAAHDALRPGGRIAFESRDPRAQPWVDSGVRGRFVTPDGVAFTEWAEVLSSTTDLISYELHYAFADGRELVSRNQLRFRDEATLSRGLRAAGFDPSTVYGDWDRRPASTGCPELIYVATRVGPSRA